MSLEAIQTELFRQQDSQYRDFQIKLLPTVEPKAVIGVRTPALRQYAKALMKQGDEAEAFLNALPHRYFDENQLHAFMVGEIKDYERCLERVERFLPFVDNWATCDQLSPKVFKKHRAQLLASIQRWMSAQHTYTVRFGIKMLMEHFLDETFAPEYLRWVAKIRSEEYYVNMMIAWYFATALAKQYAAALPFIADQKLDPWCHNKAIQKAAESYRIPAERKAYLKTQRVK